MSWLNYFINMRFSVIWYLNQLKKAVQFFTGVYVRLCFNFSFFIYPKQKSISGYLYLVDWTYFERNNYIRFLHLILVNHKNIESKVLLLSNILYGFLYHIVRRRNRARQNWKRLVKGRNSGTSEKWAASHSNTMCQHNHFCTYWKITKFSVHFNT